MTIKEIAELAGVSISTVSKIVNNKDQYINPATRERVLRIVKEYNYTPYGMVKNLSARRRDRAPDRRGLAALRDMFDGKGKVRIDAADDHDLPDAQKRRDADAVFTVETGVWAEEPVLRSRRPGGPFKDADQPLTDIRTEFEVRDGRSGDADH